MRPWPAADEDAKADLAVLVAHRLRADVVHQRGGPVDRCPGDGDLELAREEREFGVHRRPLADELGPRPRIDDLVRGHARERIGRRVAHAIAAGLDRVHLHGGEERENVGDVLEPRPVELNVLPRREMAVASVILAGNAGEHAKLRRRHEAVGNRDAKHRRVLLDVEAVLEAQRAKLVLGELAAQEALRLVAELGDPALHQGGVEVVVAIHETVLLYNQMVHLIATALIMEKNKPVCPRRHRAIRRDVDGASRCPTNHQRPPIVLLAHGARDPRWGEPFLTVLEQVRADAPDLAVELAYLEHLAPSLADAVRRLAERGARSIRVVPLFFGRGGHLREDVPRLVAAIAAELPGIAIEVTLPAGDDASVQRSLASFCLRARAREN